MVLFCSCFLLSSFQLNERKDTLKNFSVKSKYDCRGFRLSDKKYWYFSKVRSTRLFFCVKIKIKFFVLNLFHSLS